MINDGFINNFLSNHFLDHLDTFEFLGQIGIERKFPKNTIITKINEKIQGIYLLTEGVTRSVIIGEDGNEKTIFYNTAPCFFNEGPYFSSFPSEMEIHAQTDCTVRVITWLDINNACDDNIEIEKELIRYFAQKSYLLLNQITDLLLLTPRQKTLKAILTLAKDENISFPGKEGRVLNFSQNDLAKICGLHRVTVSSIISELKESHIVSRTAKGKIILVKNFEEEIKKIW
ncbi:Crp/Fnr family transcriptional regulator [Peptococcus simiae]|uniref:Crp/Fnr family transcriptional regulator n=1 Tax=Peptococcus simiae TaxID=1643805 RepID=UPI0039808186